MECVDQVARTKIEDHEERCDERHVIIRAAIGRIEKVLIGVAGTGILFLLNHVFKVV